MSADDKSVVVTGLGATTPLGGDVASTWAAMLAGRSGVQALTDDWAKDLPVRIAGTAAADPAEVIGRVQARRMDRCEQFALVAAREAWADAGQPEVSPERLGVSVTSGIGGIGSTLAAYDILKEKGWQRISPFTVPMLMPNGSAGWISIELGAQAGAHSTVSACASGAEAVGYGIEMIRSGRADVVVAGGTEAAIMALNMGAFAVMRALSARNDEPERASRPFDKGRDGFVLGEGAGMLVLESAAHAAARGRERLRRRGRGRVLLRRLPHRPPASRGRGRHPGHAARAGRRATSPRTRSCTSTRTPPPRRRATWPRRRPSRRPWARRRNGSWSPPPSR